jgi:K+-sensing histidine kinase KdpD
MYAASLAGVEVDCAPAPLLRLAFMNLSANAPKYSRDCKPPRIEIGVTGGEADEVTFFVQDNGAVGGLAFEGLAPRHLAGREQRERY